jgi:hypothetical protein
MADDRTPPEEQPEQTPAAEEQAPAPVDQRAGEESPAADDAPVEAPLDEERPQGDPLAAAADETGAEEVDEEYEEEEQTPRVKPEIPGADLEVDIVEEGADPLARIEGEEDEEATAGEGAEDTADEPIAAVAIDLAAGARYRATGKRAPARTRSTAARSRCSSRARRSSAPSASRSRRSGTWSGWTSWRGCTAVASPRRPARCVTASAARCSRPTPTCAAS